MHFSTIAVLFLSALATTAPLAKRQALASTTYNAISISGGKAGNAAAEALAVFSAINTSDPSSIGKQDIAFLNKVNQVANDAETEVFNPAIEAATGAAKDALSAGKIKNKVLKLTATKLQLEAKQAQGEDVAAKLADETKKLNTNIATDKASAGKASTALPFDATISGA